jgi:hypothetical protein
MKLRNSFYVLAGSLAIKISPQRFRMPNAKSRQAEAATQK